MFVDVFVLVRITAASAMRSAASPPGRIASRECTIFTVFTFHFEHNYYSTPPLDPVVVMSDCANTTCTILRNEMDTNRPELVEFRRITLS